MNSQFGDQYKLNPVFSDHPGNFRKQSFIEDEEKRLLREQPVRPETISYYEKVLFSGTSAENLPVVGIFCNMIPPELILSMGAVPLRLDCGNSASAILGEEILSGDICPLAKATFGQFLRKDSPANRCQVLILPSSCDAKRKMAQTLNDYKPVFMLNLPPEKQHTRYGEQVYAEFQRLIAFLEKHLQARISKKKLKTSIQDSRERSLLIRQIQDERIREPRSLSMPDFFLIIQSMLFGTADASEWNQQTKCTIEWMRSFRAERRNLKPRLILTGAPLVWPNYKILHLLEESGADIIADTLCSGAQACFDPVVPSEWTVSGMIRALSNRYVFAPVCPCFISQESRLHRVLELCEQGKAHGVVNHALRLCQPFDMETYRIERTLKERRIPFMNVRTDYSLEDKEQLRVRIEAFLETL